MSVTTGKSALAAVSDAVMDVLNVDAYSGLSGVCPGGVWTDPPSDPVYPMTWYFVTETPENTLGHFGREVELRVEVFSQHNGLQEAHAIMTMAIDLLNTAAPTMDGFVFQYLNHLGTIRLPSFLVGGRSVKHLESRFEIVVLEDD